MSYSVETNGCKIGKTRSLSEAFILSTDSSKDSVVRIWDSIKHKLYKVRWLADNNGQHRYHVIEELYEST